MNNDYLLKLLNSFRRNVELAWDIDTKYPKTPGGGVELPAGQCVVTSRLLVDVIYKQK